MWWSLTFKRLARKQIRSWTSILGNSETACASITPYVEFLMNSLLKKFLFIVDAVFGILTALLLLS